MTAEYQHLLSKWLKGHQDAQAMIVLLFDIAHTCDDLTDRDKTVSTAQMQQAFWKALIDLPRNSFYAANFLLLNGALQVAFVNWQIANQMEASADAQAKPVAFVLRSSYTDLITLCAWILGGTEWAMQVGYESRLHASGEGYDAYLARLRTEQRRQNIVEV